MNEEIELVTEINYHGHTIVYYSITVVNNGIIPGKPPLNMRGIKIHMIRLF